MLFVLLFTWQYSLAQDMTVTGTITSAEDGEPLPGVSVLIKGTSTGTSTDLDGNFRLTVPDRDAVLVTSFIGFETTEIPVGNQSIINIAMQPDLEQLEEVVVVGYGTQVRRDLTGAVSSVKAKDLENFKAAPAFDQALQGLATGVQVSSQGGQPGSPTRVMVRGTNSIFSGTEPLWIIDGMILSNAGGGELGGLARSAGVTGQNPLSTINPNDIESIEVLKDAAATAIYGSRGSNGVIIVTTKSGKKGRGTFDISMNYGVSTVLNGPEDIGFVDGSTWLSLADQSRENAGQAAYDVANIVFDPDNELPFDRSGATNTNWFDEALQNGYFTDINISTSRSTENASYYISGQYREDEGILVGSNLKRYNLRANLDFKPVKGLSLISNMNASFSDNERAPNGGAPGGNANLANPGYNMSMSGALPWLPIFHPTNRSATGEPLLFNPRSGRNLRASLNRDNYINDVNTYRLLGLLAAEYEIPFVDGLKIRTEFGYDLQHTKGLEWAGPGVREDSKYGFDNTVTFWRLNTNGFLTYDKSFGDNHSINLVAGIESTEQASSAINIEAQELFGGGQQIGTPGDPLRLGSSAVGGELRFLGYFGRANYKFMDRYLIGASLRRDAVSIFNEDLRDQVFAAVSAGWIISEENFMSGLDMFDLLKLRGSFGQTGNFSIDALAGFTTYAGWGRYGDVGAGDLLTRIGNQEIQWETTDAYDVGLDFGLFKSRISGSIGYYRQDVFDVLATIRIPQSSGIFSSAPTIWANIGDIRNQGFEFQLQGVVIDKGDFKWNVNANFTTNKNEVIRLDDDNESTVEIYNANGPGTVVREGQQLGYFRLARYAGIHPQGGYELIEELDLDLLAETGERVATGNLIPATRNNMQQHLFDNTDKSGLPTFFGGFTNTFTYKGVELTAQFSFQGGNYIFDEHAYNTSYVIGNNIIRQDIVNNTWTESNPNAEYPEMKWNRRYDVINEDGSVSENQRFDWRRRAQRTDRHLQKGDFLRLRTLQVAYNLPKSIAEKAYMQNIRVFAAANNLLTITGYDGIDPEVVNLGGAQGRNTQQGWVGTQIPQVRTYHFGATLSF